MWFIVRLAWIQNTSDKNECFLIGTFIIVGGFEKPKTTVPKDSIELVIRSIIVLTLGGIPEQKRSYRVYELSQRTV